MRQKGEKFLIGKNWKNIEDIMLNIGRALKF